MFNFLKVKVKYRKEPLELFEMKMHETLYSSEYKILRVPGGWLYIFPDNGVEFVPLKFETGLLERKVKNFKKKT